MILKHTKRRRYKKHQKSCKSRRLRGGKVFGRGTYGVVLGEPRIPCDNEEFARNRIESKQEVSKLFFKEQSAKDVVNTLELLDRSLTKDELKELNQYFILPDNLCKINKSELKKHKSIYNDAWREGTDLSKHTIQTTSDQGKHDLYSELMNITTKSEIIDFLKKMKRIIQGIDLIHSKNIIHGDLKLQNAMVDLKDNFKIIDVDELRDIKNLTFDESFFYNNHSYPIWPTIVIMFLINYYKTSYKSNDEFIQRTVGTSFNIESSKTFHTQYDNLLKLISRPEFEKTFLEEKDPTKYEFISNKILKILVNKHGKKTNEHLLSIYKFIDRYSFGIMLLTTLARYFEIAGVKDDDELVDDLIEIIEYCCFIENGLTTTTSDIKKEYIKFVDSL